LVRPHIDVAFDRDGRSNWSGLIETLSRSLNPDGRGGRRLSFSEIRIAEGTISLRDERRKIDEVLTDVALSFGWPSISRSFGATGRFVWREEPVQVSANVSDVAAALSGERSGVKVRLAAAPAKVAFDGHLMRRPAFKIEGVVQADGASVQDVLRWAGRPPLPSAGFGRFALKAQTSFAG